MVRSPSWPCAVLLLGGALLLLLGGVALYGRSVVLDERAFADRASVALAQDEVQEEIGDRIATREIEAEPALAPLRPTLDAAVGNFVHDWHFPAHFRAGVTRMHRELFSGQEVDLAVPGTDAWLRASLSGKSRQLLPPDEPELFHLGGGRIESGLVEAAPLGRRLSGFAPLALVLGFALLVISAVRAPTRRRGARRAALGFALAGGAVGALTTVGRGVVLSTFDTSHGDAVVGAIWDAFLGDLRMWGLAAGAAGLIAAAAFEPGARGAWRCALRQLASPHGTAGRLARAAALLVLAVLLLWMPEVPLELALVTLAGLLVFTAAAEVVRVSLR
jgi:hypothetical protein